MRSFLQNFLYKKTINNRDHLDLLNKIYFWLLNKYFFVKKLIFIFVKRKIFIIKKILNLFENKNTLINIKKLVYLKIIFLK